MIRFVARWDQNLKCRSKQIRQGERTLLENRPLCHDNNGLILLSAPHLAASTRLQSTANGLSGKAGAGKNNEWRSFLPNHWPSEMRNENRAARGEPSK